MKDIDFDDVESIEDKESNNTSKITPKKTFIFLLIITGLLLIIVPLAIIYGNPNSLEKSVKVNAIMSHLQELNNIANKNGGSRTSFSGFNDSVKYVLTQLKKYEKYFEIKTQEFSYLQFFELEKPRFILDGKSLQDEKDFQNMRYSGSGNLLKATLSFVGAGCTEEEWQNFPKDNTKVALISRSNLTECNINSKVTNAILNNATAIIIYDDEDSLLWSGITPINLPVPVFSVGFTLGVYLSTFEMEFSLYSNNTSQFLGSTNIIAETKSGNKDYTICSGSHLDSVAAGPGINDDASGSSMNLEIAITMAKLSFKVKNRVRFYWFGAEELGKLGSKFYISNTKQEELNQIYFYINTDMIGSPNYVLGVFNTSHLNRTSHLLQSTFETYLKNKDIPYQLVEMGGGSDYQSFIDVGVAAGGFNTGLDETKTIDEYHTFGGIANAYYDPCYHNACDTVENINPVVLNQISQTIAYTISYYSKNKDIKSL